MDHGIVTLMICSLMLMLMTTTPLMSLFLLTPSRHVTAFIPESDSGRVLVVYVNGRLRDVGRAGRSPTARLCASNIAELNRDGVATKNVSLPRGRIESLSTDDRTQKKN